MFITAGACCDHWAMITCVIRCKTVITVVILVHTNGMIYLVINWSWCAVLCLVFSQGSNAWYVHTSVFISLIWNKLTSLLCCNLHQMLQFQALLSIWMWRFLWRRVLLMPAAQTQQTQTSKWWVFISLQLSECMMHEVWMAEIHGSKLLINTNG